MSDCLFLDRDGVFNELLWPSSRSYRAPWTWSEVKMFPGLEVLSSIRERGYLLVMVTNQPDIERGLVDSKFVEDLNAYFAKKYILKAVYACPHSRADHPDKKPNPGMLLRAAGDLGIDLSRSWFLGDTASDTLAAKRAGCRSILIDRFYNKDIEADHRIFSYSELTTIL